MVKLLDKSGNLTQTNLDYPSPIHLLPNPLLSIKFIIYRDDGEQIRVFWNGFQIVWERAPFDRSKRRLKKWFD